MKTVKINELGAGKWADPNTNIAQIIVAEGDIVEVSNELAALMCPNCAKDITSEVDAEAAEAKQADEEEKAAAELEQKEAEDKAAAEAKEAEDKAELEAVEKLKPQITELIAELKLKTEDYNLGVHSEELSVMLNHLTTLKAAAKDKKAADKTKKSPAAKDKKDAESK